MSKVDLVIACGDPAGCGPLITLKAIEELQSQKIIFFVAADKKVVEKLHLYRKIKKRINLIDLETAGIEKIKPGIPSRLTGQASLNYLRAALKIMQTKKIKRLVTAPLSKEALRLILPDFKGHTEYLGKYFKIDNFAMMMVSKRLKIVLLTRHILLREVSTSLRKKNILKLLFLVYRSLQHQFKIKQPKIAFSSLNPHAGVNTFLEREEKIMVKAISEFGKRVCGPYPADTLFVSNKPKTYDCIICSYHDQAMIPFKLLSFSEGVNVTLGLPIIRTSPVHGTAFDIMRKSAIPNHSSMTEAVKMAARLNS